MTVRNEEKKAFRDLTPEERSEIVEEKLRGNVEAFNDADECMEWRASGSGYIRMASIYRTRPRQLVIPWKVIRPEYKWAAMDDSGAVWVYAEKPYANDSAWGSCDGLETIDALNIDTAGIDWRESLTARPEGV